jgi:UDP-N-acetylmuramate-alanine ligase
MQLAREISKNIVVVYEPLTDRRQHYMKDLYKDVFLGAKKVYWLPSYLAREDPNLPILTPEELITRLSNKEVAEEASQDKKLKDSILAHAKKGDLVVCMAGGGGGSLDEWLRYNLLT